MGKETHGTVQITGSRGKVASEINKTVMGHFSERNLLNRMYIIVTTTPKYSVWLIGQQSMSKYLYIV